MEVLRNFLERRRTSPGNYFYKDFEYQHNEYSNIMNIITKSIYVTNIMNIITFNMNITMFLSLCCWERGISRLF